MSVQALSWVFEHCPADVPPQPRLVLMSVANHAGPRGENSYPSVATIARETGMNPRQVQRWTAWLVDQGLLAVKVQGAGDARIRADRRPNQYTIVPLAHGVTPTTPRDGMAGEELEQAPHDRSDPATTGPDRPSTAPVEDLPDGVSSAPPRTATGCHPRSDGVSLKAPRGGVSATQTVIEPKTEPSGTSSSTTSSNATGQPAKDQEPPHRPPVDQTRARDFLRRARRTITAGESLKPVTRLLEADRALAGDLGLIEGAR